jgi:hypothetical protein
VVMFHVIGVGREHGEVGEGVVAFVSVFVMDDLTALEREVVAHEASG